MKKIFINILAFSIVLTFSLNANRGKGKSNQMHAKKVHKGKTGKEKSKNVKAQKVKGKKGKSKKKANRKSKASAIERKIAKLKEIAKKLDEKGKSDIANKLRAIIAKAELKMAKKKVEIEKMPDVDPDGKK